MFEVGDKVVCIDVKGLEKTKNIHLSLGYNNTFPVLNGNYTIRESSERGVLLEEIVNPKNHYLEGVCEPYFKQDRFVKLSDLTEMEEALEEVHQILEMVSDFKPFP